MSKLKKLPESKVLNPRYEGATPAMVARALLRAYPDERRDDGESLPQDVDRSPSVKYMKL